MTTTKAAKRAAKKAGKRSRFAPAADAVCSVAATIEGKAKAPAAALCALGQFAAFIHGLKESDVEEADGYIRHKETHQALAVDTPHARAQAAAHGFE